MEKHTPVPDAPPSPVKPKIGSNFVKKRVGYGPLAAILVMVSVYLFSQLFAGVIIGFGAELFGKSAEEVLDNYENSAVTQFMYIALVEAITVYCLWLFMKLRSVSWKDIGLGRLPVWNDLLRALIVFAVYFATLISVTAIISRFIPGINTDQEQQIGFENIVSPEQLVLVFISLVILPPIVEEILVRGFLYTGLRVKFTKIWSAIIASVLFGIAHLQLGSGAPPLWIAAIDTAILSLFLIYLREKTGALWSGMIVHGIKNGLAFFILFVVK